MPGHGALAQGGHDLRLGRLFLVEVQVHDRVVEVGHGLDQVVAVLLDQLLHAGRDVQRLRVGRPQVVRVDDRLLGHEVDVAR